MESNSKYQKVKTADNSITFKSLEFKETYHSTSGAYEEALKKHIEPSGILNKIENKTNNKIKIMQKEEKLKDNKKIKKLFFFFLYKIINNSP